MKINGRRFDKNAVTICCMAILSAYALTADFAVFTAEGIEVPQSRLVYYFLEQLRGSIEGKGCMLTLLTAALLCFYRKAQDYVKITRRRRFILCAVALAFGTLIHYPYTLSGSISLTYSTWFQVIKSLMFLAGYAFLIYHGILALYQYIKYLRLTHDSVSEESVWGGGQKYFRDFCFLAILWLPHIIVKLPGAFSSDTGIQIRQALGLDWWTGHHPVFMTWILKMCLQTGNSLFYSFRAGILLYFFLQAGLMISVFSYSVYLLESKGVPKRYRNIVWMIYALCPYIVGHVGVILKDVSYSAVFLWFVISLIHFLDADQFRIDRGLLLELTVSAALTILCRKNGKEIVYPTLLVIGIVTIWKNKRQWKFAVAGLSVILLPILCTTVISLGLTRYYEIIPGSIKEALSMPFQQTARVVVEHGDEIPEEEKGAIDVILQYDSLPDRYTPMISDPVKNIYNDGATTQEMLAYAKVWFKQLCRYPLTYAEAAMHQNYPLFDLLTNDQNFYFYSNVEERVGGGEYLIEGYPIIEKIEARGDIL